jgi:hypothetical protein
MARKTTTTRTVTTTEPVLEEVETGGLGLEEGVILTTFLALLAAVVLAYMALGRYPG